MSATPTNGMCRDSRFSDFSPPLKLEILLAVSACRPNFEGAGIIAFEGVMDTFRHIQLLAMRATVIVF